MVAVIGTLPKTILLLDREKDDKVGSCKSLTLTAMEADPVLPVLSVPTARKCIISS